MTCRESQLSSGWPDTWVRYLDHFAQIEIEQRGRYHHLIYLRGVDEDKHHQNQQDQSTKMQRLQKSRCKGNRDKIWESLLSQRLQETAKTINSILTARVL